MPTPVSVAKQYLTEDAARALDDAVAIARRRSHAQTHSVHAVSALLALPASTLRDACRRARSGSCSSNLQFRALELSVGVSLDRLATSKTPEDEPPVSNSLMAAVRRSQANQKRNPESFHLLQIHNQNQQSASVFKVELKHFILSILDDPIVSRVFGEAGFRSCDIKMAILQPPISHTSRFSRSRCPPLFLCNITGSETGRSSFNFPFMGSPGLEDEDENSRRICQVLGRKSGRNPLLMGVCASDALRRFAESVQRGVCSVLPVQLAGLNVVCIEKEISEFLVEGGSEDKMDLKFKELSQMAEQCLGPGVALIFGELKVLIGDGVSGKALNFVVSQLTSLLGLHAGRLWLVGLASTYETYSKFLTMFPGVDKDWDLQILPITSASPSMERLHSSKSSLMTSFVPFGGFFSTPSDPVCITDHSFSPCHLCTQKYDQEVAEILNVSSTPSVSDSPASLAWLQKAASDISKATDIAKTKDDQTSLNARIFALRKKWNEHCQHHCTAQSPKGGIPWSRSLAASAERFQFGSNWSVGSRKDRASSEKKYENCSSNILNDSHKVDSSEKKQDTEISRTQQNETEKCRLSPFTVGNGSQDFTSTLSLASSVTTDLGLGTFYASTAQELNKPNVVDQWKPPQNLPHSLSAGLFVSENNLQQDLYSNLGGKYDSGNFKLLYQNLLQKVGWQVEAISTISQVLSGYKSGSIKHLDSNCRRDIWLVFHGADRVGKKKIASALSETLFAKPDNIISFDLDFQRERYPLNSVFEFMESCDYDLKPTRKTVVDHIAEELRQRPHGVVFVKNVDQADPLAQNSLLQAIRTGKFPDSRGREISVNNIIFILTSTCSKGYSTLHTDTKSAMFSEEIVLQAKRCQMQLLLGDFAENAGGSEGINVKVTPRAHTSKQFSQGKRKLGQNYNPREEETTLKTPKQDNKTSLSFLDLNLPVESVENPVNDEDCNWDSNCGSSEVWLDDFFKQADGTVTFMPFDFDALGQKILKGISQLFQRTFGMDMTLEISYEVMVQLLAAAWVSDMEKVVNVWIEQVLGRSFDEAQNKYHPPPRSILKLVTCEGFYTEKQAHGFCLPPTINLS